MPTISKFWKCIFIYLNVFIYNNKKRKIIQMTLNRYLLNFVYDLVSKDIFKTF